MNSVVGKPIIDRYTTRTFERNVKPVQTNKFIIFCGSFVLFLSCFCYAFVRVGLLMPCGWKRLAPWLPFVMYNCEICHFSIDILYPRSGVVIDCIDS